MARVATCQDIQSGIATTEDSRDSRFLRAPCDLSKHSTDAHVLHI